MQDAETLFQLILVFTTPFSPLCVTGFVLNLQE